MCVWGVGGRADPAVAGTTGGGAVPHWVWAALEAGEGEDMDRPQSLQESCLSGVGPGRSDLCSRALRQEGQLLQTVP